jgi:hypothetical protein
MENEDFMDDLPNHIGELKDIIWLQRQELIALRKKVNSYTITVSVKKSEKFPVSFNKKN